MIERGMAYPITEGGVIFTPNERDLVIRLLKRFGAQVVKNNGYEPQDVSHPVMLSICNEALGKFGEESIALEAPKS